MRKTGLVLLGLIALAAAGYYLVCAFKGDTFIHRSQATITGTVSYRERIALPAGSVIEVSLLDTSRADAPATTLAQTTITTTGENVPIPFTLEYKPSKIEENMTYTVSARITVDGKLRWISDQAYPVITNSNPTSDIAITVKAATAANTPKAPATPGQPTTPSTKTTLDGTFRLTSFNTTKMESSENYTITFGNKNKFTAKFCNSMSGTYKTKGATISSEMLTTLMFCSEPSHLATTESAFNKAMGQGVTYTFKDKQLILKASNTDTFVFEKVN